MFMLPFDIFVTKITKSDDLQDIKNLCVTLTKIQFTKMEELLDHLNIDSLREKLLITNNLEEKQQFINQLRFIEYPYVDELEIIMKKDA